MKLSRGSKALILGFCFGAFFTGCWLWLSRSDEQKEPMLMPGQDRSIVRFEDLGSATLIFICTDVPVTLLIAFRRRGKDSP